MIRLNRHITREIIEVLEVPEVAERFFTAELAQILRKQLEYDISDTPGDLIDTLIELLRSPGASTTLQGPTLERIRRALLTEDEYQLFVRDLRDNPAHCTACGHRFSVMEMATISLPTTQGMSLRCTRCAIPSLVACAYPTCQNHAPIPAKTRNTLKNTSARRVCAEHSEQLPIAGGLTGVTEGAVTLENPSAGNWSQMNFTVDHRGAAVDIGVIDRMRRLDEQFRSLNEVVNDLDDPSRDPD